MLRELFQLPLSVFLLPLGAMLGLWLFGAAAREKKWMYLAATGGAVLLFAAGTFFGIGAKKLPVHGYGTMILLGFLLGVWMARRRAHLLGIHPDHCNNVGVLGVIGGLLGARMFHVFEHWEVYSPFGQAGLGALYKIIAIWEGGLVFYGAFIAAIAVAAGYCLYNKIPPIPFLDLAAPSLIAGLALGRLGCFMNGCCFGKLCSYPWGVHFPKNSAAYEALIHNAELLHTPALHPTQIYAFMSAALTSGFLYYFWQFRRFNGQIFALMLTMAGATRFFEEFLRNDTGAALPTLSSTLTIAQWIGMVLAFAGLTTIFVFRRLRV